MGVRLGSLMIKILLAAEKRLAPVRPSLALLAIGRRINPGQLYQLQLALGARELGQWRNSVPTACASCPTASPC